MKKEAASRALDVQIIAVPMDDVDRHIDGTAVMLLGPQIRFKLTEFETKGKEKGIPVAMINSMDYGMVNGKKILDTALALAK